MNKLVLAMIASSLVLLSDVAGAQTARARIAATPIRAEANLASAIIATVQEGGPVDVVDLQGEWYRVLVPTEQGKPRVGYVLANLVEIRNTDGVPQVLSVPPALSTAHQGQPIPPTLVQLARARDGAAAREQSRTELDTARAERDAATAELDALKGDRMIISPRPLAPTVPRVAATDRTREAQAFHDSARRWKSAGLSAMAGGIFFQVMSFTAWATTNDYCSGGYTFSCTSFKTADPVAMNIGTTIGISGAVIYIVGKMKDSRAKKMLPAIVMGPGSVALQKRLSF